MTTNNNWATDLKRFRTKRRLAVREMWDLLNEIDATYDGSERLESPRGIASRRIRKFLDRLSPMSFGYRRFSKESR